MSFTRLDNQCAGAGAIPDDDAMFISQRRCNDPA